jgi:hypothetical protein
MLPKSNKCKENYDKYYKLYNNALEQDDDPGIILAISRQCKVSPCIVSRFILKKFYDELDSETGKNKLNTNITPFMRNTTLIQNMDLAYEVYLVCGYIAMYKYH